MNADEKSRNAFWGFFTEFREMCNCEGEGEGAAHKVHSGSLRMASSVARGDP